MKRVLRVFIVLGVCYFAICVVLFIVQRKLIFPAPTGSMGVRDGMERVNVPGATFFLSRIVPGDGPVVVHFHGNAEQVASLGWLAQAWAEQGVSFVAVEYPGYPGTDGSPSEDGIVAASEAALQHLVGPMKIDRARLVLEGQSVGTGVAVTLASRGWGSRLVLLSPYTSLPAVAARAFPWLPVSLLMRDRFDSASRAAEVKVPTLIVHGTKDQVIPFELGEALSRAIPGAKLLKVVDVDHNDLWDRESTQQAIFAFVAEPHE